ncbi:tyrosine-type recombinase/integrase [Candidatus Woesebacteria bacterium]|nr:tyrosine-type recombinase/integrase [Candidatus Woesebacteria bacterium]MBP6883083.1 tyrosine-type recombinase/integrase [Candidatus Woesebacteria bacterium]
MKNDLIVIDWPTKLFANLDVSENTRLEYGARIRLFIEYVQKNGFTKNSYLEYKRYLAKRTDLSVSTKNKYLIVARVYCKELNRQGYLPVDVTQNIKSFQQSKKHKRDGFSEDEVQKILAYLQTLPETHATWRIKALISLLILQGLRQIEIIRLNVRDLDLASKTAFIQGKGQDDKEVVDLHPVTVTALKGYIKKYRIADGALFTSTSNKNHCQRLGTRTIRNIINPILRNLEIDKSCHGFRHYFTSKLIQSYKGDLLTVAQYTRHKSLETLQIYNDNIKRKDDLPRYYQTFSSINFQSK